MNPTLFILLVAVVCFVVTYVSIEFLIIKYNGQLVPAPTIDRTPMALGTGPKLTYVVMGDSTSIGQGAVYNNGYAVASAQHLAKKYAVTLVNTGVSGARLADIASDQLPKAVAARPDIVLLGAGANDTTHFTDLTSMQASLQRIINNLRQANPDVRIVATRSPAIDSVSRFPWLSKHILRHRTARVNEMFDRVIGENNFTPALIAEKTRDAFLADPTLTAADNFHPNKKGYGLWIPIINDAVDAALRHPVTPRSHS